MHKKYILILFVAVILLPCVACANVTDKRGLVEFVELYTQRMDEYQQVNGTTFDLMPGTSTPSFWTGELQIVESLAGSIGVYPGDFTVHDVLMTLSVSSDEESANQQSYISCAAAMSALEFDASQDKGFRVIDSSAMKEAILNIGNIYIDLGDILDKVKTTGSRVLVYSGNYDYYVDTLKKGSADIVYLIAEERK